MKNFKIKLRLPAAIILTFFMLLFIACDQHQPIAPNQITDSGANNVSILKMKAGSLYKVFNTQKMITAAGDSIIVGDSTSGLSGLYFPAGAVNDSILIGFIWNSEGLLQSEFSPHGTVFNLPVYIKMSYLEADLTGIVEDSIKIYYYNDTISDWEVVGGTVNKIDKYVEGYINHFSRYGIGTEN